MSNGNTTYTLAVNVKFTLYSAFSGPPYNISGCEGTISYNNNVPDRSFQGWVSEVIGTPDPNGATFTIVIADSSYSSSSNVTSIANWAITFIPRGDTTAPSPFGNNVNTIAGTANDVTNNNGQFTLSVGNNKIKTGGDWDWSLMVQMVMSDQTTIKCFASDPEMEVNV